MNKSDIDLQKEWEQRPTPDLKAMLNEELDKKRPDDDIVLSLLHILEAREPEGLPELTDREREAFERYKQRVAVRRKKPIILPRWLSVAACGMLILGLLFNVVPQEAHAETFWEMLQRWSNTVLVFFSGEGKKAEIEYTFRTDNAGLQQVYDAVAKLGVTEMVVPMWLPDGYELVELQSNNTPVLKCIWAVFNCNDTELIYQINIFDGEPAHQFYRDDSHYESYEKNGTTYNITRNNERWVAIWSEENIECSLTADCQEDTLRRVLESIYVMEDN